MLRGLYTAASGMMAQQRKQETLSNNLANVNTNGYKADQSQLRAFPEMLLERMESTKTATSEGNYISAEKTIGSINTGVYVQENIPNFVQGDIQETGTLTDAAIVDGTYPDEDGAVFFTVQAEEGAIAYTRNGNFTIDGEGFLTDEKGHYLLDTANNPIQTNNQEYTLSEDGTLQFADGNTAQLAMAYTADSNQLEKQGDNLFIAAEGALIEDARANEEVTYGVEQGYVEASNVDAQQTMTDMMQAYRTFELNQTVMTTYDESLGKAVNDVGKL